MHEDPTPVVAALARILASLETASLDEPAAAELLEVAGEIERLGSALRFLVAGRAAAGPRWQDEGYRTPAAWVAAVSRSSVGDARTTLETSERLGDLPATREALRTGALSSAQVNAIADAATADPASEEDLLQAASLLSVEQLRGFARDVRASASDPDPECRARLRRRRFFRAWTDADGMLRFSGAVTPDAGAEVVAAVRSRAAFVADEAAAAGLPPEPQEAYDADALVALVTGDLRMATFSGNVGGRARHATVVMHVSVDALRRGAVGDGELCAIAGLGSVSIETLESILGDGSLALALHGDDGDCTGVVDLGPTVPLDVARALEDRDRTCVVPGCSVGLGLVTDYWPSDWRTWAGLGAERPDLPSLAKLCRPHHRQKVDDGFTLVGGPGRWEWRAPP